MLRHELPCFADEPFGALVFRCRERRDHLHDLVRDHRCRLVLAERRFGGAMDRGDPSAQRIAERVQAFDDATDRAREFNRCIPISSERELLVC